MSAPHAQLLQALGDNVALRDLAVQAWAHGVARWPAVHVEAEAFAQRLIARTGSAFTPSRDLDADLYLATALGRRDPAAIAAFEAELLPQVDGALARLRLGAAELDDLKQGLRVDLLVGDGTRAPRIDTYLGHGPLVAWLRVSAIRRALTLRRSTNREESLEELVLAGWPGPSPDAAASDAGGRLLRQTYTAHLKTALTTALAELSVRERNLLRHSIIDELTVDELALMYRVHRSTCARWLVDARAALGRATRRALSDQLGPLEGQLDSVLRLVESDVELSLSRLMRDAG